MAERLRISEPIWLVPYLWRAEFRNTLTKYMRHGLLSLAETIEIQSRAEALLADHEFIVASSEILRLTSISSCSAYDCEFVALARQFDTKLVTTDKEVLREFPETAISLRAAVDHLE